jgi:hypothetical protein
VNIPLARDAGEINRAERAWGRGIAYLHLLCVPTLNEPRRHSANTQVVQSPSGKIQTGHTPPFVETPTDLRWQTTLGHSLACARLGGISDIRGIWYHILMLLSKNCNTKPVYIENGRGMYSPYSGGCALHRREGLPFFSTRILWATVRRRIQ